MKEAIGIIFEQVDRRFYLLSINFLGFNIFYTSFPIHAISGLGWTVTEMGVFFAVLSGMMVLVQGPILRRALKKFSEEKLVIIGSVILGANFALLISNNVVLIYGAASSLASLASIIGLTTGGLLYN